VPIIVSSCVSRFHMATGRSVVKNAQSLLISTAHAIFASRGASCSLVILSTIERISRFSGIPFDSV
jgi:hypothetical protein